MLERVLLGLLYVVSMAAAISVHGMKTLLIYDSRITDLGQYQNFLGMLRERQYQVEEVSVDGTASSISLYDGDVRLYDNLILFPIKSRTISKDINVKSLLQFFEEGGSVLAVTSPNGVTESARVYLEQMKIHVSPRDYKLVDYFHDGPIDVLPVNTSTVRNKHIFSSDSVSELTYSGSSALLRNDGLVIPVLPAPRTSLSKNKKGEQWTAGSQGYLVASVQNLNNARTSWVGSDSFFNDGNWQKNGAFVEELIKWTFGEKAVIKSTGFTHKHSNGLTFDQLPYKIKDNIFYEIGFSEWNGSKWVPFHADDIQFELRMLDPYYRLTLEPSRVSVDSQYYSTGNFALPDHHGVYTFVTQYMNSGLSFVIQKDVKPIRHLANDEYPRSYEITNSWVFLCSISAVIALFVAFVAIYLFTPVVPSVSPEKKKS
ncbi:ADL003Cp [Eremothecium gossypii ATCC 10895]|uniref:Dolichyl-diphosphooligosaccharide--protein glycosyltransferase subunit WBP1 n=1 Tax=Eremothecium gossypii (strain ATCC 10895 / CBS 109.51 / FGSC 9923 / NRRL Y-1056) TaxID=284811 RepID=Q75AC0_EREGS|nr:ADL003Cp [Eremothecium gossypii ATCC 10895]AAS51918.2 ADL003Cp [Eremothecium gossypii ATCC 10895]AEY96217.1 FADL003Cp [Eremothecium gossypii FDAG1]